MNPALMVSLAIQAFLVAVLMLLVSKQYPVAGYILGLIVMVCIMVIPFLVVSN